MNASLATEATERTDAIGIKFCIYQTEESELGDISPGSGVGSLLLTRRVR